MEFDLAHDDVDVFVVVNFMADDDCSGGGGVQLLC